MIGETRTIRPLITMFSSDGPKDYVAVCRECGDVTMQESGGYVDKGTMQQAGLYRQRHLARHLTALSEEITEAAR